RTPGKERRQIRPELRRIGAFEADHANVPLKQAGHQMREAGLMQLKIRQVEYDGTVGEKSRRAREPAVQLPKPLDDGPLRRKDKSHVGSPKKAHRALRCDRLACDRHVDLISSRRLEFINLSPYG